jgi:uncharacterized protein
MHYHIVLNEACNLQCRYCYQKSLKEFENSLGEKFKFDFSDPCSSVVKTEKLKEFLLKDKNPVLIFYGGEPLTKIQKIIDIIDSLEGTNVKFRMQTNGILLDRLPIKYLKKIDKILVSLDGTKERTDYNRGKGTYEKVISNLEKIKKEGYRGEIIARMTIAQDCPDLYSQVLDLIKSGFNSIHWQIDCGFYENDFESKKTGKFFKEYNKEIEKLVFWWVKELEKGNFYRLYPFVGIIHPLLKNKKMALRCGAGHSGYAISTSGKVVCCPIMNNIEDFKAGTLNSNPEELKKFSCKKECDGCSVYYLCGGRCMYWRKAKLWPEEGDKMICNSIKHYINLLKENLEKIKKLIEEKKLSEEDFLYEEYFGPEIIP